MRRSAEGTVSPQLLAAWLRRHQAVEAMLRDNPHDAANWAWHMRHRMLGYLLRRYGDAVTVRELMDATAFDDAATDRQYHDEREPTVTPSSLAAAREPSPADAQRLGRLCHLASLNKERYALLAAMRPYLEEGLRRLHERPAGWRTGSVQPTPISTTYPDAGFALPDEALRREQRAVLEREVAALRELVPEDDPMSETDIVALLEGE